MQCWQLLAGFDMVCCCVLCAALGAELVTVGVVLNQLFMFYHLLVSRVAVVVML
jgi:hypothetical protein